MAQRRDPVKRLMDRNPERFLVGERVRVTGPGDDELLGELGVVVQVSYHVLFLDDDGEAECITQFAAGNLEVVP